MSKIWTATTIIILIIVIVALALNSVSQSDTLLKVVKANIISTSGDLVSVQRISADNSGSELKLLFSFCPQLAGKSFFLVTSEGNDKIIYTAVDDRKEMILCRADIQKNMNVSRAALSQNLIATVNKEPVYAEEVIEAYNQLPAAQRTNQSIEQIFDQLINNKLLVQYAKSLELIVSDDEVQSVVDAALALTGSDMEQSELGVDRLGEETDYYKERIRNNLLLQKVILEITKNVSIPSDEQIRAFYEENKQSLVSIPSAQVNQIYVSANESNLDEKLNVILGIGSMINTTDFCILASQYSEDSQTKDNCGLYNFSQGQLLPEFEQAVFDSSPQSIKIIKTRLGYHLIRILDVQNQRQLEFDEVKSAVQDFLLIKAKQQALNQKISDLKSASEIVNFAR